MIRLLLPIAALLSTAACAMGPASGDAQGDAAASVEQSSDLTGSSWVLRSVAVDGSTTVAVPDSEATLSFDEGARAAGSTGCNRFTASWQQDGDALRISVGAVTMAACRSEALSVQESALLEALAQVAAVDRAEQSLTLRDADGAELLVYAAGLSGLAGTSWTANGINNQTGGVESNRLTSTVTAQFSADGTLSGFTGCRDYRGAWQTDGATISVGDLQTSGVACSGDEATLEQDYLQALSRATTFRLEGSTLNLRDSDGATQVNYSSSTR